MAGSAEIRPLSHGCAMPAPPAGEPSPPLTKAEKNAGRPWERRPENNPLWETFLRVQRLILPADLKVEVRTGRPAGGTHESDLLPLVHGLSFCGQELGAVGIVCGKAVAVVQNQEVPVGPFGSRPGDGTPGRGQDVRPGGIDMSSPRWKLVEPKMVR